jgi:hypothetical protein
LGLGPFAESGRLLFSWWTMSALVGLSEADICRIVAYLDGLQAKVDDLRRLQAETQKELDALMPSVLAKAFAGTL